MAARIPATVNRQCSDKSCSTVSPAASFSKINSTVKRVPVTVGFPIMTLGSEVIRASDTRNLDSLVYNATLRHGDRDRRTGSRFLFKLMQCYKHGASKGIYVR